MINRRNLLKVISALGMAAPHRAESVRNKVRRVASMPLYIPAKFL
jgi:hypothetical protein